MKKLSNFWRLPYSRPPPPAREKARAPREKKLSTGYAGRWAGEQARKLSTGAKVIHRLCRCGRPAKVIHRLARCKSYPQVAGKSYPQVQKLSTGYASSKVIHKLRGQVGRCESYAQVMQVDRLAGEQVSRCGRPGEQVGKTLCRTFHVKHHWRHRHSRRRRPGGRVWAGGLSIRNYFHHPPKIVVDTPRGR